MKRPFSSLHARALCHATEVLDRVKQSVTNTVGDVDLETKRTAGHHGNDILVVEAHSTDSRNVKHLFDLLSAEDRELMVSTIDRRLDDSCNLFLRVDKQAAYEGRVTLGASEDSIALRLKVSAFPAKPEVAAEVVTEFVSGLEYPTE